MGAVGAKDSFFVSFAEDENEVVWLGEVEGFLDGFFAVEFEVEVLMLDLSGFLGAFDELGGNSGGVFVAGVVFGDNDDIAVLTEDFSAQEASGFVAATGATVDGDDFALMVLDGLEDLFESVGCVGVINDNFKMLTLVNAIHTTFNRIESGDTLADLLIGEAELFTNSESGKRIINVEFAGDLSRNFYITT